jgi:hypothetical protein
MTTLATLIWIGGVFARPDKKIGFWNRVWWPEKFGARLAEWALRDDTP